MDYTCRYTKDERPNLFYPIIHPKTKREVWPKPTRVWAFSREEHRKNEKEKSIWWGKRGTASVPAKKNFLHDIQKGFMPVSLLKYESVGHTDEAAKELRSILPDIKFTPKPARLIKHFLSIGLGKDGIVLDSFAGSGTTAHATLAINREDGGNRKFILVECEDYADKITAERVRRVIKGVPKAKDETLQNGLGGSFTYCTLGDEISPEKMLTGENLPDYETLAHHLVYTATGQAPDKIRNTRDKDGFFYEINDRLFYLIYEPNLAFLRSTDSALNSERAERIAKQAKKKQKTAIVFATHKFMGQKELTQMGITFCGLPYEVFSG